MKLYSSYKSLHLECLWKAGIKRTIFYLKRLMTNAGLYFEVFYTSLTEIEAILNTPLLSHLSLDSKTSFL